MSDTQEQILIKLKNKDLKAYEHLFFKYHGRLVLFAMKFTGDLQSAKDIAQDAFFNMWNNAENLKSSPKAYLFQSARNLSLNYNRHLKIGNSVKDKLNAELKIAEQLTYFDFNDPYYSLLELELSEKIEKTIESLPDRCLEVFKLSRYKHMKNKEIAEYLGISVKAVEKHISKALAVLRRELAEYLGIILIILLENL